MGKKSLEKLYHTLFKNLWNELLFYIPDTELVINFLNKLNNFDKAKLLNIVFVMDKMQGPIEYHKKKNTGLLYKSSMLEDNLYLLLKMKRKLNELEFCFLIDKYFEIVEFSFYITNSLQERIESDLTLKFEPHLQGLFLLQHKTYKKHFNNLIKHFYPKRDSLPTGNFDVLATIEKYFPELIKKYESDNNKEVTLSKNEIAISNNDAINTVENGLAISTHSNPKEKNKLPQPTQLEVEEFLLKSVFGIK